MTELLWVGIFLVGLAVGGLVAWALASSTAQRRITGLEAESGAARAIADERARQLLHTNEENLRLNREIASERESRVVLETRLDASEKNLEEQKKTLETMKKEMTDSFTALSSAALRASSEEFLRLASENLGRIVEGTKGRLGEHQKAMDGMMQPLSDALKQYEEHLRQMEEGRQRSAGALTEQLRALATAQDRLERETRGLVTALRKPQVSGSWGQMSLKRAAELAGMTAYCDFYEQTTVAAESGRLRPDMVVRLPNDRVIVVDAKAPVDAYLNAIAAEPEEERERAFANYVAQVRNHMNGLGAKAYWDQFAESPEIVVMFLPGESFFSAALEHDRKLIEDGSAKRVIIATPTTFIALLKAVAYGWQQAQATRSAQEVTRLGKELYDRVTIMVNHLNDLGSSIRKANEAFNRAVGSLESRILPSVRRFRDLGVSVGQDMPDLDEVDRTPRTLAAPQEEIE